MFFVVRIRGTTGVNKYISDTLKMLRLNRINHGVLVEDTLNLGGMLRKAKDYITWGEIDSETLAEIISKRGEFVGGVRITDESLAELNGNNGYSSIEELAKFLISGEVKAIDINMKPVFRLHPPRKGHKCIKSSINEGGSLGYRGESIKNLIKRMI